MQPVRAPAIHAPRCTRISKCLSVGRNSHPHSRLQLFFLAGRGGEAYQVTNHHLCPVRSREVYGRVAKIGFTRAKMNGLQPRAKFIGSTMVQLKDTMKEFEIIVTGINTGVTHFADFLLGYLSNGGFGIVPNVIDYERIHFFIIIYYISCL